MPKEEELQNEILQEKALQEAYYGNDYSELFANFVNMKEKELDEAIKNACKGKERVGNHLEKKRKSLEKKGKSLDNESLNKLENLYSNLDNNLRKAYQYKAEIKTILKDINGKSLDKDSINRCIELSESDNDINDCIKVINNLKDDTRDIGNRGIIYQVKKQYGRMKDVVKSKKSIVEASRAEYLTTKARLREIKKNLEWYKGVFNDVSIRTTNVIRTMEGISEVRLKECLGRDIIGEKTISEVKNDLSKSLDEMNKKINDLADINKKYNSIEKYREKFLRPVVFNIDSDIKDVEELRLVVNDLKRDVDNLYSRIDKYNKQKEKIVNTLYGVDQTAISIESCLNAAAANNVIPTNRPSLKHIPLDVSNVDMQSVYSYVSDESGSNVSGKGKEPERDSHRSISNSSIVGQSSKNVKIPPRTVSRNNGY